MFLNISIGFPKKGERQWVTVCAIPCCVHELSVDYFFLQPYMSSNNFGAMLMSLLVVSH